MPGCVDQIQLIDESVFGLVVDADRVCLDRDATFALKIHLIEQLRSHVTFRNRPGAFEQPVCEVDLPWSMCAMMLKLRMRD